MEDKRFFEFITSAINKTDEKNRQMNECARIALAIEQSFTPAFSRFLEKHKCDGVYWLSRKDIINEPCNYDIRKCMTDDFINVAAQKGYEYRQELSNPGGLVFYKRQQKENS